MGGTRICFCIPIRIAVFMIFVVQILLLAGSIVNLVTQRNGFGLGIYIPKIVFLALGQFCLKDVAWPRLVAFISFAVSTTLYFVGTILMIIFEENIVEMQCDREETDYRLDANTAERMLRGFRGGFHGGNGNWQINNGEWENDGGWNYDENWTYGECFESTIWQTKIGLITLFVLTVLGVKWTGILYMWWHELRQEQCQG